MYCVDGVLYVDAEKEYQSSDYITFTPLEDGASLAAPNRTSMFLWKGDKLYERNGTNDDTQLYYGAASRTSCLPPGSFCIIVNRGSPTIQIQLRQTCCRYPQTGHTGRILHSRIAFMS